MNKFKYEYDRTPDKYKWLYLLGGLIGIILVQIFRGIGLGIIIYIAYLVLHICGII